MDADDPVEYEPPSVDDVDGVDDREFAVSPGTGGDFSPEPQPRN